MRLAHTLSAALAMAITLLPAPARATVTEPNGLAVPINSSPEVQLYTLFSQRGESINWQTDAHETPNAFSPLCGFTATYVLNQAGAHYGLAWYNDTGKPPASTDLHPLVPPNSAVGTTFTGTQIKADPAYTGGQVGFALVGGETHYTNASYDTACSACSPPGPWVTALMYASTKTPDAYYVCFEDGPTSAGGWQNDGDFNDDVYFVTGITCAGGGQPCDTGKPGICAAGVTQCAASGTTCHEINPPAPKETCNGLDDDCNGQVDEGNPCPTGDVCVQGTCVHACGGTEFPCPAPLICASNGFCEDPKCANVTCPSGQVCVQGLCKGPCDGVKCPAPQVCEVGKCVDPCAGVVCASGQVCTEGVCVTSCACQPCATGKACNATSGQCVDPSCTTVSCAAGTYCLSGKCVDDCTGAVCPSGQTCKTGSCVAVPDAGTPLPDGGGLTGPGKDGGSVTGSGDGSASGDDGGVAFDPGARKSGCGCRTVGRDGGPEGGSDDLAALAVGGLAVVVGARARSRRRRGAGSIRGR